jgi:hypothetical protein
MLLRAAFVPPPYSASLGCDDFLDGWCEHNCRTSSTARLLARQPSSRPDDATFSCFDHESLSNLETVTSRLSSDRPLLCGKKSKAWVRNFKMTEESVGLVTAKHSCMVNRTIEGRAAPPGSRADVLWGRTRRATIAGLNIPLLLVSRTSRPDIITAEPGHHAMRAHPYGTTPPDRRWQGAGAPREMEAARCVAHGN